MQRYTGPLRDGSDPGDNAYSVTVNYIDQPPRMFVGWLFPITWEVRQEYCIYAGNGQGGWAYEVPDPFNDPVIEGNYADYRVDSAFATEFQYSHFEENRCSD